MMTASNELWAGTAVAIPAQRSTSPSILAAGRREAGPATGGASRRATTARTLDLAAAGLAALLTVAAGVPIGTAAVTLVGWGIALTAVSDTPRHRARLRLDRPAPAFAWLVAGGVTLVTLVGSLGAASIGSDDLERFVLVAAAITAASLGTRATLHVARRPTRVLVLGGRPASLTLACADRRDTVVVGVCDVDPRTGRTAPARPWPAVSGQRPVDLVEAVRAWGVDVVAVAPTCAMDAAAVRRLGWELEDQGVDLAFPREVRSVARHRAEVGELAGQPVLVVRPSRPSRAVLAVKSVLDRVLGSVLLVAALPVLAVLAVLVRLDSPGPALFRQTRVGRHGQAFTLLKLRTMCAEAETLRVALVPDNEADAVLFKIRRDPRVTRVGRWLRRLSLDELPQLVNVVRGEMSLVGPRPALPHEVELYDEVARRRLAVRPGITGLWQVNGRSDLDWQRSVDLDVHYTDNITISGDLAICLRTVRAVAGGRGAY
jgi:exopolysaccharide biosynthesis polyprenyl glycosylphosphotransferase